ncbi:MAG: type II toxin-antitoxin system VapC family toxin [Planctomycetes bacterium]|nr:type II toxin-antitoxin system VapC family toxin [Planctomycetota bacterium]
MIHGIDTSFLVAVELSSHSQHVAARQLLLSLHQIGDRFGLAPQVLAEFVHIVTDSRRCAKPLTMGDALDRASQLWNAVETVRLLPSDAGVACFFTWMRRHRLGRKRLLDTQLAATFHAAGIGSVLSLNRPDFELFGCFSIQGS